MLFMQNRLPEAINAALTRCSKAAGKRYRLPVDFEVYPVLKVNSVGRCTGVSYWLARMGEHLARGDEALWAIRGLCASRNGGTK
jgi:hypothetical protein